MEHRQVGMAVASAGGLCQGRIVAYLDMKKLVRPLVLRKDTEEAMGVLLERARANSEDAADALAYAGELAFEVNVAPAAGSRGAATLVFQGDRARAEELFRQALRIQPAQAQALYGLAR